LTCGVGPGQRQSTLLDLGKGGEDMREHAILRRRLRVVMEFVMRRMRLNAVGVAVAVVLGTLAGAPRVEAQHRGPAPRIAVVFGGSPVATMLGAEPANPLMRALLTGLRELGYVEDQNLIIERRSLEGQYDRAPEVFAELLRLRVQVIVAAPRATARAAQRATTTIPIVTGAVTVDGPEPLVASPARPGGNITGLAAAPFQFGPKLLELLKEALPGVVRVAILIEPDTGNEWRGQTEAAARTLGLTLAWTEVEGVDQVADALEAAVRHQPDALVVSGAARLFATRRQIAAFALRHRLPMVAWLREMVEEGALMSYGYDLPEIYRRAATYVDKLLKGATPADLPIEMSHKFSLVINLKTAEALGITIPPVMLFRADEVIR
jgi:putative ABC transport system substrate-binding protein